MPASRSEAVLTVLAVLVGVVFLVSVPASVVLRRAAPSPASLPAGVSARVARLSVSVSAVNGAPVPRATARVFWADGRRFHPAGSALTDDRGVASLTDLPTGASWVLVEAPGFARRSTALVLARGERSVSVVLQPASTLAVRVEDEAHAAIPGATVLVTSADALPFGALTDASGTARFARLPPAPWTLRGSSRGYESVKQDDVVSAATLVLRRASSLDVTVLGADGHAAPGATVLVAGSSLWPARRLAAGADGHAVIPGIDAGTYDLKALSGDLVSPTEVGVKVARGEVHPVTLTLGPGRVVSIVVTDGEGEHPVLVPNADVLVVEGGVSSFPIQGRTDRFGKVLLGPVAPGQVVAAGRADGFVSREVVSVPDVLSGDVRISLLRGGTLRGDVVDGEGRPVDGATIEVVGTDTDGMPIAATPLVTELQRSHFDWALPGPAPLAPGGELGVMLGPIPAIPSAGMDALPVDRTAWDPGSARAEPWVTAFDGSFVAMPIPPGRVRALVRHPAYVEATSEMVTLGPGGEAKVRVVLRPGGSVEGIVVDDSGVPVAGARLEVAAVTGTLSRTTVTADDGTFALASMPADLLVTIARPDEPYRAVVRKQLSVPDGKTLEVTLTLPAPRPPVEISVEDDSRRPVKLAQVTALSLDPSLPLRFTDFTDEAGRVVIKDAVGLPCRFVVEAPGFARYASQTDSAPSSVTVELVSGVLIEGHVTAVRGRRDVDGAAVELLAEGHRRVSLTNALGLFQFPDVSPGAVHLRVSHPDYAPSELDAKVEQTGRSDRAFEIPDVDLAEAGTVSGHVVDAEGNPVSGARVGVGVVGAYLPVGALATGTVTTKADGAFQLVRVHPGKIDVAAVLAGKGRGRTSVIVDEGHDTGDVVIRLGPGDDAEPAASGGVAVTLAETHRPGEAPKIVVVHVAEQSEAEHAGIVSGDVLRTIDRALPTSLDDARLRLSGPDGSDVVIEVVRGNDAESLRVRRERVHR